TLVSSVLFILFLSVLHGDRRVLPSFPTRRSSDLRLASSDRCRLVAISYSVLALATMRLISAVIWLARSRRCACAIEACGCSEPRSEEHTSELQSRENLVCRLLLEKKNRQSDKEAA